MKTIEIQDLSRSNELTSDDAANARGGIRFVSFRRPRAYWGPIPFNKDPATGGEMTRRYLESLRRTAFRI